MKSNAPATALITFVRIRITNHPGKYAMRGVKGDILVAPKAQASEFPSTESTTASEGIGAARIQDEN
jgi:hypothetical protein